MRSEMLRCTVPVVGREVHESAILNRHTVVVGCHVCSRKMVMKPDMLLTWGYAREEYGMTENMLHRGISWPATKWQKWYLLGFDRAPCFLIEVSLIGRSFTNRYDQGVQTYGG